MDRSFLSQPAVIAASRRFVCVRLMSYENAEEAKLLKSLTPTGSGELENTVFAVLSSDGQRKLARAGRSARSTFGDAAGMATGLARIADEAGPPPTAEGLPELPRIANLRLAVDVAACDNRPLVVVYAPDAKTRDDLEARLRPLAWGERFLGRFVYAAASSAEELALVGEVRPEPGVFVVQPDRFGLKGAVLKQVAAGAPSGALPWGLTDALSRFRGEAKSFGSHVRAGQQQGVFWETALPVTDPMERGARERGRRGK
jgi:hypothetical protein